MIEAGDQLPDTGLRLRSYLGGGPLLVLFYTEANTPLCTQQLCAFRDDEQMLLELNASVVAISSDAEDDQEDFKREHYLPFSLLSDPDLEAARAFGVNDPDSKRSRRAAFVADADGVVQLAISFYQPNNLDDYQRIFEALGLDI